MNIKNLVAICLGILLMSRSNSICQQMMSSYVIGTGSAASSNASHTMLGTIGQSTVGRMNNQSNMVKIGFWEQTLDQITSVKSPGMELIPKEFYLYQNYPNPFNPSTKISWQSPVSGWQILKIYDVLGNEIATPINEFKLAGLYEIQFDASSLSSGVYFYKLKIGSFISTKKMILLQ